MHSSREDRKVTRQLKESMIGATINKGLIYKGWLHSLLVILESCGLTAVMVITPVCLIEMSAVCCLLCTLKKIHKRLLLNFPPRLSGLFYCTTLLQLDIYGIIVDTETFVVFRCNLKKTLKRKNHVQTKYFNFYFLRLPCEVF